MAEEELPPATLFASVVARGGMASDCCVSLLTDSTDRDVEKAVDDWLGEDLKILEVTRLVVGLSVDGWRSALVGTVVLGAMSAAS